MNWRKSGHSADANCVEVADFRKSSRSGAGGCVEAGSCRHGVAVRDTQDRDGPVLTFDAAAWEHFISRIRG